MQNYICINNQKIELTEEQIDQIVAAHTAGSVKLADVTVSDIVKIGSYEMVVLEQFGSQTALILKYLYVEESEFADENNKYDGSMDDFYLIHPSKEYLRYCLEAITAYLETLGLALNGKTQIFPFKNGVNYLGFHAYIAGNGKPIRRLKNQNKRNAQKKFLRMAKLVAAGRLSMEKFEASYGAWKNHISHGNCYRLGRTMDERINELLQINSAKETERDGS